MEISNKISWRIVYLTLLVLSLACTAISFSSLNRPSVQTKPSSDQFKTDQLKFKIETRKKILFKMEEVRIKSEELNRYITKLARLDMTEKESQEVIMRMDPLLQQPEDDMVKVSKSIDQRNFKEAMSGLEVVEKGLDKAIEQAKKELESFKKSP